MFCSTHVTESAFQPVIMDPWDATFTACRMHHPVCASLQSIQSRRLVALFSSQSTHWQGLLPKRLRLARCWSVPPNAFIKASLVHCGITGIDNRVPKILSMYHMENLFIWEGGFNEAKQLQKTLHGEIDLSFELIGDLLCKRVCIFPGGPDRETSLHKLRILRGSERHAKSTARAGYKPLCYGPARKLGKDTRHNVECSSIQSDTL